MNIFVFLARAGWIVYSKWLSLTLFNLSGRNYSDGSFIHPMVAHPCMGEYFFPIYIRSGTDIHRLFAAGCPGLSSDLAYGPLSSISNHVPANDRS
jgi:hypothetical protein